MKFSKRMLVMLVATVMLVAGSLSYFAYANDVEPCGPVIPHTCPNCRQETMVLHVLYASGEPLGYIEHTYNGIECNYYFYTRYYRDECRSCNYITNHTSETVVKGHSCGMPNDE